MPISPPPLFIFIIILIIPVFWPFTRMKRCERVELTLCSLCIFAYVDLHVSVCRFSWSFCLPSSLRWIALLICRSIYYFLRRHFYMNIWNTYLKNNVLGSFGLISFGLYHSIYVNAININSVINTFIFIAICYFARVRYRVMNTLDSSH